MTGQRTRDVVPLILRSIAGEDPVEICRGEGVNPDRLAQLKAGFIAAGTAWLHQAENPRDWIQINVRLKSSERLSALEFMTGPILDAILGCIQSGLVEEFHYVFKPPGVRLRFLGETVRLVPALVESLAALEREGMIQASSRTCYDAETFQLGGLEGVAVAHRFFTLESVAALRFLRLALHGKSTLGIGEFSITLLDLFLRQVVGDEWELWDLWSRMALTGRRFEARGRARVKARRSAVEFGQPVVDHLRYQDRKLKWIPAKEREILRDYCDALSPVVARVRELRERGALLFPLREILPFWIVFHFNRMGFSGDDQCFLSFVMQCVLSPKASLPQGP